MDNQSTQTQGQDRSTTENAHSASLIDHPQQGDDRCTNTGASFPQEATAFRSPSTHTPNIKIADLVTLQFSDRMLLIGRDILASAEGSIGEHYRLSAARQASDLTSVDGKLDVRSFIHGDGVAWQYIVQYLNSRHYPLLWDIEKGFDIVLYARILVEAERQGLQSLAHFISNKSYKQAIKIKWTKQVINGETATFVGESTELIFFASTHRSTLQKGVCPRSVHDDVANCGNECERARGKGKKRFEQKTTYEGFLWKQEVDVDMTVLKASR